MSRSQTVHNEGFAAFLLGLKMSGVAVLMYFCVSHILDSDLVKLEGYDRYIMQIIAYCVSPICFMLGLFVAFRNKPDIEGQNHQIKYM